MTAMKSRVLLIGYGNPGRLDDGLGPALADAVERLHLPGVDVDADYQLTVEDAAAVACHDVVIFADAAVDGEGPFYFRPIRPKSVHGFSSHSVEPAEVLGLAHGLFGAETSGYVLGIRGYEFNEFAERISPRARRNLAAAVAFLERAVRERNFVEAGAQVGQEPAEAVASFCGDDACKMEST